jgi:hypothetical protein
MAAPAPAMAAPSPAFFLSHGNELMGNAKKDHLLQRTEVARFHSLFGTSPILCIYQIFNLISLSVLTIHIQIVFIQAMYMNII